MSDLNRRVSRLEQDERRRLLQRLRDAQGPREMVLAGQAIVDVFGPSADPRCVAATLAAALDLDPEAMLAEAGRLADHPAEVSGAVCGAGGALWVSWGGA